MKSTSYIIRYRGGRETPTLNFGPFVSMSVADYFRAELPKPLEGGYCLVQPVQPYTAQEGHIVAEQILRDRKPH